MILVAPRLLRRRIGKSHNRWRGNDPRDDTLDGYACSSWYLWRYTSPHDKEAAWNQDAIKYWAPTDVYVGGDHAVAHFCIFDSGVSSFADQGYLPFREPIEVALQWIY